MSLWHLLRVPPCLGDVGSTCHYRGVVLVAVGPAKVQSHSSEGLELSFTFGAFDRFICRRSGGPSRWQQGFPGGPAIRGPWVFLPFFFSLFVPPGCPPRDWQPRGGGLLLPPFTRAWMNLSLQLTLHPALRPTAPRLRALRPRLHGSVLSSVAGPPTAPGGGGDPACCRSRVSCPAGPPDDVCGPAPVSYRVGCPTGAQLPGPCTQRSVFCP